MVKKEREMEENGQLGQAKIVFFFEGNKAFGLQSEKTEAEEEREIVRESEKEKKDNNLLDLGDKSVSVKILKIRFSCFKK